MKNLMSRKSTGFTLIEVLVVMAIIGVLATIVFIGIGGAREKSRDSNRVSDLKNLELALALYFEANGDYPDADDVDTELSPDFLPVYPTDPSTGSDYNYNKNSNGFYIVATLEGDKAPACYVNSQGRTPPATPAGIIDCNEF